MARRKNVPQTNNTARKSTATRPPIVISHSPRTGGKNDSTEIFKKKSDRLTTQVRNELLHYKGPTGLGRGKGGLRRSASRLPKKRDIIHYANSTKSLIALAPFQRLVKHLTMSIASEDEKIGITKYQAAAIAALRTGTEAYLQHMFETSNLYVLHASRVTVMCKDLALFKRIENGPRPVNNVNSRHRRE